jgi:hypothetical protein
LLAFFGEVERRAFAVGIVANDASLFPSVGSSEVYSALARTSATGNRSSREAGPEDSEVLESRYRLMAAEMAEKGVVDPKPVTRGEFMSVNAYPLRGYEGGPEILGEVSGSIYPAIRAIFAKHGEKAEDYLDLNDPETLHVTISIFKNNLNQDRYASADEVQSSRAISEKGLAGVRPFGLEFDRILINNNALILVGNAAGTAGRRSLALARNQIDRLIRESTPAGEAPVARRNIIHMTLGRFGKPFDSFRGNWFSSRGGAGPCPLSVRPKNSTPNSVPKKPDDPFHLRPHRGPRRGAPRRNPSPAG